MGPARRKPDRNLSTDAITEICLGFLQCVCVYVRAQDLLKTVYHFYASSRTQLWEEEERRPSALDASKTSSDMHLTRMKGSQLCMLARPHLLVILCPQGDRLHILLKVIIHRPL